MCSVIGYYPIEPTGEAFYAFERLFDQSRIRGMHSYGITASLPGGLETYRSFDWREIPAKFCQERMTIAHCRYSQSGDFRVMANNQPIVVGETALAHNGVISMGTKSEYEAEFGVTCAVDNDSEIFLQKLKQGVDAAEFIQSITGSFAATWLADGKLYAGHNVRRPLWKCVAHGAKWYASTEDIFKRAGFSDAEPVSVGVEVAWEGISNG